MTKVWRALTLWTQKRRSVGEGSRAGGHHPPMPGATELELVSRKWTRHSCFIAPDPVTELLGIHFKEITQRQKMICANTWNWITCISKQMKITSK